jgi:aminoacylase
MKTVHPNPTAGYEEVDKMLRIYSNNTGIPLKRLDLSPGHPIFLLIWIGRNPLLGSVLLNSHTDVVPAEEDKWKVCGPFSAEIHGDRIYGRGTQDMKIVGSAYLEAVARLKARGYTPLRTLTIAFVPDEEVGGGRGMKMLLGHSVLKELRPVVALDEGLASTDDKFSCFYGERKIWWLKVRTTGPAGHGSRFIDGAAVPKLLQVANAVAAHQANERAKMDSAPCGCGKTLGDYTTANLTYLKAGIQDRPQYNVVPTEAEAGFDVRISPHVDLVEFEAQVAKWCEDAGATYEFMVGLDYCKSIHAVSDVRPESVWWRTFLDAAKAANAPLHPPSIFPAATDSRWIRMLLGIPCFGFSPLRNHPILLHDHDEYVTTHALIEGIQIYEKMIEVLCEAKDE